MNVPKKQAKLNNGLTPEQVTKAREVLAKVNVTRVCEKANIERSVLENVLRGTSKKVEVLKKVLTVAKRQVKQRERTLKALPL
jgi:predicted transcriptional regulator